MKQLQPNQQTAYVVDDDLRLIYADDALRQRAHRPDERCYEALHGRSARCAQCPLFDRGQNVLHFDKELRLWTVSGVSDIAWPNAGRCHLVTCNHMETDLHSFFREPDGRMDESELLTLNYAEDSYALPYRADRAAPERMRGGSLRAVLEQTAETSIHPDDRRRFLDFWEADSIGRPGVPPALLKTRYAEFRHLLADGSYQRAHQMIVPVQDLGGGSILVMTLHAPLPGDAPQAVPDAEGRLAGRQRFFARADARLAAPEGGDFCMIAVDIEKFKLFNEWYGTKAGDRLLAEVSAVLQRLQDGGDAIAGYFGNDDFALFLPHDEGFIQQIYRTLTETLRGRLHTLPAFGVYRIETRDVSAFRAFDYAKLACSEAKKSFADRIRYFDQSMIDSLESEYLLFSDIQRALKNKEFTFFLQPKHDMRTGAILGAEALARWISPEKGLIPPGAFLPFLERSGFISELDTFVWESVCQWLRRMIDRGQRVVPVSVNVSRHDLYAVDVPAFFDSLIRKYRLDPALIELEITEESYAGDDGFINQAVDLLRRAGFRVLMDDFGKAYSSLNMLKDIAVDALKIDIRFLDLKGGNAERGQNILESVCNMARILNLDLIAEGVETEQQRDLLLGMNCFMAQGFLFHRPMPAEEFEAALAADRAPAEPPRNTQAERFSLRDLMGRDMLSEIILNNMLGAVVFYKVEGDCIRVTHYNDHYSILLYGTEAPPQKNLCLNDVLKPDNIQKMHQLFGRARRFRRAGAEGDMCLERRNSTASIWLHMKVFLVREQDGSAVYSASLSDVTEVYRSLDAMQFLNSDMPGGYYHCRNTPEGEFLFTSQRFLEICGYSRKELELRFDNKLCNMVHPDDRHRLQQRYDALQHLAGNISNTFRLCTKNGYLNVTDQSRLTQRKDRVMIQGIVLYDLVPADATQAAPQQPPLVPSALERMRSIMANLPCGVFVSEADGDHTFRYVSQSMLTILGYSPEAFREKFKNRADHLIHPPDRAHADEEHRIQMRRGPYVSGEFRVPLADGSLKWVYTRGHLVTDRDGKRWFYSVMVDYEYLTAKYGVRREDLRKYRALAEMPGMFSFDYDPAADRLTVEVTQENGKTGRIVANDFTVRISDQDLISPECVPELLGTLRTALTSPMHGMTEFRSRFSQTREYHWYRARYVSLAGEDGRVYRVIGRADSIESDRRAVSDWKDRAQRDALTGLLNGTAAREQIRRRLRRHGGGTLLVIDLDDFKAVNDTLGHIEGDRLLSAMGDCLRAVFREGDTLARMGGDEFLVFLPGLTDRPTAAERAGVLLNAARQLCLAQQTTVHCSVGLAVTTEGEIAVDTLIGRADAALYRAKGQGKNRFAFWEADAADPQKDAPPEP